MPLADTSDATRFIGIIQVRMMASATLAKLRRYGAPSAAFLALACAALLMGRTSVERASPPTRSPRHRTVPQVKKPEGTLPSGLFVVPEPQIDAMPHDLVRFAEPGNRPTVLQTTAIEVESSQSQLGSGESTDAMLLETSTPDDAPQSATTTDAAAEQPPEYHYPMTSFPDAETDPGLPPPAKREIRTPASQRRLPGPVNLVVGRDRNTPQATAAAVGALSDNGPRDTVWSRWTQGWRRKFGQSFSDRKATHAGDAASGLTEQPEAPADRSISAAANEAWYNRRWR